MAEAILVELISLGVAQVYINIFLVLDVFELEVKEAAGAGGVDQELGSVHAAGEAGTAWHVFVVVAIGFSHFDMGFGDEFF